MDGNVRYWEVSEEEVEQLAAVPRYPPSRNLLYNPCLSRHEASGCSEVSVYGFEAQI